MPRFRRLKVSSISSWALIELASSLSSSSSIRQIDKRRGSSSSTCLRHSPLCGSSYHVHTILTDNDCPAGDLQGRSAERGHPVCRAAAKPENDPLPAHALRHNLRRRAEVRHRSEDDGARDRAPAHQAEPSLEFGGSENSSGDCFPTNGQVERMNRTIKEGEAQSRSGGSATAECKALLLRQPRSAAHPPWRLHLASGTAIHRTVVLSLLTYNSARRLKTLGSLTPYEYICKIWTSAPDRFILDPIHQMPGLDTWPWSRGRSHCWPSYRYISAALHPRNPIKNMAMTCSKQ